MIQKTKPFKSISERKNYIVYSNVNINSTKIFKKIGRVLFFMHDEQTFDLVKKDLECTLKWCEKYSKIKSKCRIDYHENRIEIFKEGKYIFPEILINNK